MNRRDRIRILELFCDGFSITELGIMYDLSVFRVMGILNKFGIDI